MLTNDTNIDGLLFSFTIATALHWNRCDHKKRKVRKEKATMVSEFNKFSRYQFKWFSVCIHTQKVQNKEAMKNYCWNARKLQYAHLCVCVCVLVRFWLMYYLNNIIGVSFINNRFLPNRMHFNHFSYVLRIYAQQLWLKRLPHCPSFIQFPTMYALKTKRISILPSNKHAIE